MPMLVPANNKTLHVLVFFAMCALLFRAGATCQAQQQAPDKTTQAAPADRNASRDASKYVGAETCKTCHEDTYNAWEKTPHWKTTLNKEPSHQGCEGCHGPGADHVAGGGDKTKIYTFTGAKPEAITKRCLACHESSPEQRE